jgi:hypothetical protein
VRKGESGIAIWIPCAPGKTDAEEETDAEGRRMFFTGGTVFDISQTADANEAALANVG